MSDSTPTIDSLATGGDNRTLRAGGLDALRGLAIILMCLSGVVPGLLPNWMYHGYYPTHLPTITGDATQWAAVAKVTFVERWPGFTWVDWVFPGFLFAMGAAIPFGLSSRLARSDPWLSVLGSLVLRWLGLIAFAMFAEQLKPHFIASPTTPASMLLALLGFALLFGLYVRLPRAWSSKRTLAIRIGSLLAILVMIVALVARSGRPFSWAQHDIILLLLAHCYLIGAVAWMLTERFPWTRLILLLPVATLAHLLAINTSKYPDYLWIGPDTLASVRTVVEAPLQWLRLDAIFGLDAQSQLGKLFNLSPLWNFTWYKFLWLVIPGTLVGDWLLAASKRRVAQASPPAWSRCWLVTILTSVAVVGLLVGLRHYSHPHEWPAALRTPYLAAVVALPAMLGLLLLTLRSRSEPEWLLRRLTYAALATTTLGLALSLAPADTKSGFFEGGISKGPPSTLGYYLLSLGMSLLLLVIFTLWSDVRRSRALWLLERNGQNPMMAYVAIRNVLAPLVALPLLAPLGELVENARSLDQYFNTVLFDSPWPRFVWSLTKTLLLALAIAWLARRKIVWRT
jgi:predicted acyltransferase